MFSIYLLVLVVNYFLFTYFNVSKQVQQYLQVSGILKLLILSILMAFNNYLTFTIVLDKLVEGQKRYPLYEKQKPILDSDPDHLFDHYLKRR